MIPFIGFMKGVVNTTVDIVVVVAVVMVVVGTVNMRWWVVMDVCVMMFLRVNHGCG